MRIKIIALLMLSIFSLLFVQCGSGASVADSQQPVTEGTSNEPADLIGSWLSNDLVDGVRVLMVFSDDGTIMRTLLNAEDGSYITTIPGAYVASADTVTLVYYIPGVTSGDSAYSIEGDSLTMDDGAYHRVDDDYLANNNLGPADE